MPYQVALLNFEGPLDLLLQLVERSDLPASELSLADLTEHYLAYSRALTALDPVESVGFTALASKLLYLKSSLLLPMEHSPTDEVVELQQQLTLYAQYREAASVLATALANGRRSWSRIATDQPQQAAPPHNLTPTALRQALVGALAKRPAPTQHTIAAQAITLAEMTQWILAAASNQPLSLQAFFERLDGRVEVVVAFLAALELWRVGRLHLAQSGQFSIIRLAYA